ncbi:hypothetical protein D3C84_1041890 [compost metagenome]
MALQVEHRPQIDQQPRQGGSDERADRRIFLVPEHPPGQEDQRHNRRADAHADHQDLIEGNNKHIQRVGSEVTHNEQLGTQREQADTDQIHAHLINFQVAKAK